MICGFLSENSPRGGSRFLNTAKNSDPIFHFTLLQLKGLRLKYDDVVYHKRTITKGIIIARLIKMSKGVNTRGAVVLNVRVEDASETAAFSCYYNETQQQLEEGEYVKICLTTKCGGLAYRPQIKLTGVAMTRIQDFNEVSCHILECLKSEMESEQ